MSGKNHNRFEWLLGVWTNPVYKTSWASLPTKQAVTVGFSSGLVPPFSSLSPNPLRRLLCRLREWQKSNVPLELSGSGSMLGDHSVHGTKGWILCQGGFVVWCAIRIRAVSFFLVRRAKRIRHGNDHERDWRRETEEAGKQRDFFLFGGPPSFLACRSTLARTSLTKAEEKERLLAV